MNPETNASSRSSIEARTALALGIGELNRPVVTTYDIAVLIFRIYITKAYKSYQICRLTKDVPSRTEYNRLVRELLNAGVVQKDRHVRNAAVFDVLGKSDAEPEDIVCCIDPFSYLSHMSAMQWHGLTDRFGKNLYISSPAASEWRQFAIQKMQRDVGSIDNYRVFLESGLPTLRRYRIAKIRDKAVSRAARLHLGAFINIKDRPARVSTIGRTFLDMIREPDRCGGIYHVLQVYERHARQYQSLIVDEVDRHGTEIDRARVGYILDEVLHVENERVDKWAATVQRGGSRKLYPKYEYSPKYSERWCISINVEE